MLNRRTFFFDMTKFFSGLLSVVCFTKFSNKSRSKFPVLNLDEYGIATNLGDVLGSWDVEPKYPVRLYQYCPIPQPDDEVGISETRSGWVYVPEDNPIIRINPWSYYSGPRLGLFGDIKISESRRVFGDKVISESVCGGLSVSYTNFTLQDISKAKVRVFSSAPSKEKRS